MFVDFMSRFPLKSNVLALCSVWSFEMMKTAYRNKVLSQSRPSISERWQSFWATINIEWRMSRCASAVNSWRIQNFFGSYQEILTKKLGISNVAAKFFLRFMTEDQKQHRSEVCEDHLERVINETHSLEHHNMDFLL